jgi:chromosome segregation ATPase
MLRRRPKTPEHAWTARVSAARATVERRASVAFVAERFDDLERALHAAEADRTELASAIDELGADRVTGELKEALRELERRPDARGEARVAALRRRHETVHELRNRLDDLGARIDATVADLELLAARAVALSVDRQLGRHDLEAELTRLHDDLTALEHAHEELRDL